MPEKRDPKRRSDITRHIEALADWLVEAVNKINEAHRGEAPALFEKARTVATRPEAEQKQG